MIHDCTVDKSTTKALCFCVLLNICFAIIVVYGNGGVFRHDGLFRHFLKLSVFPLLTYPAECHCFYMICFLLCFQKHEYAMCHQKSRDLRPFCHKFQLNQLWKDRQPWHQQLRNLQVCQQLSKDLQSCWRTFSCVTTCREADSSRWRCSISLTVTVSSYPCRNNSSFYCKFI